MFGSGGVSNKDKLQFLENARAARDEREKERRWAYSNMFNQLIII